MLEKVELNLLIDYYGAFLTETQREVLALCCEEDLSLSEIAELRGISRQGARDAIARGERTLVEMESRLGLVERDKRALALINRLKARLQATLPHGGAEENEPICLLTELSNIMEGKDGV